MNKSIISALAFLFMFTLVNADWQGPQNYINAVNVSVADWHYQQCYIGGSCYRGNNEPWVLVSLNSTQTGNPLTYKAYGFSSSGLYLGNVSIYPVSTFKGKNNVLVYNRTQNGYPWDHVSIFYNPASWPVNFDLINMTQIPGGKSLTTQSVIGGGCTPQDFATGTPCSNIASKNFSLMARNTSYDTVILSNSTLLNQNFSITFAPDFYTYYAIANRSVSKYALMSIGIIGASSVSGSSLQSANARAYANATGNGFEAYFSGKESAAYAANQVIGEGMYAQGSTRTLYNATSSNAIYYTFVSNGTVPTSLKIRTNNSIFLMLIPAFTTNYTATNAITNPSAHNGSLSLPSMCFEYRAPVRNITWSQKFPTPSVAGGIINLTLPASYLMLTFPHTIDMGAMCNDIYLYNTNSTQIFEGGQVPYTLMSCNSTSVRLLVANQTMSGYTENSFYVFFGQPSTFYVDFSNSSVASAWQQKLSPGSNLLPSTEYYLVKYKHNLNVNDYIDAYHLFEGGTNSGLEYTGTMYSATGTPVTITAPQQNKVMLVKQWQYVGDTWGVYSSSLSVTGTRGSTCQNGKLANLTSNRIISGDIECNGSFNANTEQNDTIGYYPVSTDYTFGPMQYAPQNGTNHCAWNDKPWQVTNTTKPNTTIPDINVNATTTIPIINTSVNCQIQANQSSSKCQRMFPWANVWVPKAMMAIFGIIALLVVAAMLHTEEMEGGALGFIVLFLLGIFIGGWQLMALLYALTIMFVAYEYNKGKKHGHREAST